MAPSPYQDPRSPRKGLQPSPEDLYQSSRQSLRPLPQPPSASPVAKRRVSNHNRSNTLDRFPQIRSEDTYKTSEYVDHTHEDLQIRPHVYHARTNPHSSPIATPDLQELQKSTTGHLRALSKFANTGSDDFSLSSPTPSVVGLAGRRRLKRTDSTSGARGKPGSVVGSWGDRNWMDKQRQFLQAYEYLCHIGEAKEWIEDIIHKPIPPIVQLEEALRDGVTLAEIVQAFHPEGPLRIFRNAKLQFRHSDNIVTFFRFLEDVGLPDLFRFELIDLYEKKNIPKVIYCIHALSWLLYRKGMVDFRIGNLVGQLQFEHHELEQTQKGLDKSGVSMPSFKGMGQSFGAEPEPEPVETEEERIERELNENSASVTELQSQMRGALIRMRLGERMNDLWNSEELLIDLQSRIRGDWARQIIEYRLTMNRFATNLQSAARGFLGRSSQQLKEERWKAQEVHVLKLQNLLRGRRVREKVQYIKHQTRQADSGIRQLQAAIRGALARRDVFDQFEAVQEADSEVEHLQAAIKGMLVRSSHARRQKRMEMNASCFADLQAIIRANDVRNHYANLQAALRKEVPSIKCLQSAVRGANAREQHNALLLALLRQSQSLIPLQAASRAYMLRQRQKETQHQLAQHIPMISEVQAIGRAALLRLKIGEDLSAMEAVEPEIAELQALARGLLLRSEVARVLAELDEHEEAIIELQSSIRASAVRRQFAEKQRFFRENMEKVVKIQSVVRAKIQGQAYKSLTAGKNPPVGTLKGFVHLLNDSDFDFDEEIEFERLRKTVVQHVRQNELADQYINQLDVKIALLVKNKITLDEVVKHQRHFGGSVGSLLPNADLASKDPFDLKALNKASRKKLEQYQELFFLLQTQPQYLARLFRRMRENATSEKECERIKHLVMGVFGYAQKRREEYYLVKLVSRSIKEEVDAAASLQDYVRTNSFSNKLFAAYTKSPRDRKFMRDVLGGLVKEHFVDNRTLDLESDPLQIYRTAINNEELRTGQKSRRNPNVPREEAIRDPETRATFIHHMQDLRDIADQFFLCLEENLPRMPFGVRYVAQQMYEHLSTVFHYEDPAFVLSMVGQWMWKHYLQPALVEPEKFGVADRAMQQDQKRNLGEVAKVLSQAVTGREFGGENVYLQPLNNWVKESVCRFHDIWHHRK
jgi:Ras GTPase-activating-like protein IQGAP2/3